MKWLLLLLLVPQASYADEALSDLPNTWRADDEEIVVFPTFVYHDVKTGKWTAPIHGWIFELEEDSAKRRALLKTLSSSLDVKAGTKEEPIFKRRMRWFLVDNERGEKVTVRIGKTKEKLERTGKDGHFKGVIRVGQKELDSASKKDENGRWLKIHCEADASHILFLRVLAKKGISVISDIDDTIKVTEVPDKKKLLKNTFLREFRPAPGMPELFQGIARQKDTSFHYVSASPWALYVELYRFLRRTPFPDGSIHLRPFRAKDPTAVELLLGSEEYKIETIKGILEALPERIFILVGDAGERDPEVYGRIAREHPKHIGAIYIRKVKGGNNSKERFQQAFKGLPESLWKAFDHPRKLGGKPIR